MKKWLFFGGGVLVGVGLTILVLFIIYRVNQNSSTNLNLPGTTYFEQPGDIVPDKSFEVMQVINNNAALANAKSDGIFEMYTGTLYLIVNQEGKLYYDEEIINVPSGRVARQIGVYRYPTRMGVDKTVPIIAIMDN